MDEPLTTDQIVQIFRECELDHIGAYEVVDIADTGFCALRDADGVAHIVSSEAFDTAGVYMPLVLTLMADQERNKGALDYLRQIMVKGGVQEGLKARGAAKSTRTRFKIDDKATARKVAHKNWQTRSGLSVTRMAELVMVDFEKTDQMKGKPLPGESTLRGWIKDLKP